ALGMALGSVARHLGPKPEIVIGMDTRESSPWIAQQVAGGLKEAGAGVRFAGVVTTPGVAFLTHTDSFVAGVMISASHNPYQDNGIKVFGHSGYKLPDAEADGGVAFDGDADRAIFVSRSGRIVDGDAALLIAARALKSAGRLPGNLVVATVMSNLGLEKALERDGIRLLRTAVGDKYVLEEMLRSGAALGGEQSGHVIFTDYSTT